MFLSYVLSFLYLAIYWNNHHHLLKACRHVNAGIMWANLHLLFWLSLFPFFTGWMGENHFTTLPTALYGAVLLLAAVAYFILQTRIIAEQGGHHSKLAVERGGRETKLDLLDAGKGRGAAPAGKRGMQPAGMER